MKRRNFGWLSAGGEHTRNVYKRIYYARTKRVPFIHTNYQDRARLKTAICGYTPRNIRRQYVHERIFRLGETPGRKKTRFFFLLEIYEQTQIIKVPICANEQKIYKTIFTGKCRNGNYRRNLGVKYE